MAPPLLLSPLISTLCLASQLPSSRWCRRTRPLASTGIGRGRRRNGSGRGRRGLRICAYTEEAEQGRSEEELADDFYSVLGVMPDATTEEIKKAYYSCMKTCHPDLSGDDPDVTNFCMFVNEVYMVLTDPVQRAVYDEIHGYTATASNPFFDDSAPKDHVFVDEFTCIGCKICANVCPNVFEIEEDFGRSRAYSQTGCAEIIQDAIDSCPVDCIHWTSAAQLSLLEDEMRRIERVNVGLMRNGMGVSFNVFRMASARWEKRQAKVLERIRTRIIDQQNPDTSSSWSDIWGSQTRYQSNGIMLTAYMPWYQPEEVEKNVCIVLLIHYCIAESDYDSLILSDEEDAERANRAARAARRWREYSRKGADRLPRYKLPEAAGKDE